MTALVRLALACALACAPAFATAYNLFTHAALTDRAINDSVLGNRLADLSLNSLEQPIDDFAVSGRVFVVEFCIPRPLPNKRTVRQTIALGAFCEDNTFGDSQSFRYFRHFFDPAHGGRGLQYPPNNGQVYDSSLEWSLNTRGNARQTFAYNNVRDYLEQSVLASSETARRQAQANFFRGVGHLMHLIQDLGQPQHTREDSHVGSPFEARVDTLVDRGLVIGSYPSVVAGQWSDFWSTSINSPQNGRGLADFTNSQFVTQGRNLGGAPGSIARNSYQPYPDGVGAQVSDPQDAAALECMKDQSGNPTVGEVSFVSVPILDRYTNTAGTVARMTSSGILSSDLQARSPPFGGQGAFYMTDCNYDDQQAVLLPAAAGYSAGLIDYMMRGKMEINLPDAGMFSIVDHSQFSNTDVAQGFVGFSKIKLKLKNTTADLTPPGSSQPILQSMSNGILRAVLSFHRNTCYDDLLANWPLTGSQALLCRSPTEEIVVSAPLNQGVPTASPGAPNGNELTFLFSQHLPINAWDVVLRVVYRGTLGNENDVVVVATKNISEPSFFAFMNTTDYVVLDGAFKKPGEVTQTELETRVNPTCRAGQPGSYSVSPICYNKSDAFAFTAGTSTVSIGTGSTPIAPRRLARLAVLSDFSSPARLGWDSGSVTCWKFLANPLPIASYRAEADSFGNWNYSIPSLFRKYVKIWDGSYCYADIGINESDPGALNPANLDDLSPPGETTPTALTITGW